MKINIGKTEICLFSKQKDTKDRKTSKLEEVQQKGLALCLGAIRTSGREALEVELNVKPLEIRCTELSLREAGRILSKGADVPITSSWENWCEIEKTERHISPFGSMFLHLEERKTETGNKTLNIEPDFSFREGLYPTPMKPEYWSHLGSSKSRTQDQQDESRALINSTLGTCTSDTFNAFTDGSCHPDAGPDGAGVCVYLPFETQSVNLKQPVSKHGSILLGEMVAIKLVLDFIMEKLNQRMKLNNDLILSDSQSSVGLLTLGWKPTQHKSTTKDIISQLDQIKGRALTLK